MSLKKYINNLYFSVLLITLSLKVSPMKWTISKTRELHRKTIVVKATDKRITQKYMADQPGISERHFRRLLYK